MGGGDRDRGASTKGGRGTQREPYTERGRGGPFKSLRGARGASRTHHDVEYGTEAGSDGGSRRGYGRGRTAKKRRGGGGSVVGSKGISFSNSHRTFHGSSAAGHSSRAAPGGRSESEDTKGHDRDMSGLPAEETRISRQLRRLQREEDPHIFTDLMLVLNETLAMNDNLYYIQRCAHFLLESLNELVITAPTSSCRTQAANAMAFIGHLLLEDDDRYINLVMDGLDDSSNNTSFTKVILMLAFKRAILMDKHKPQSPTLHRQVLAAVCAVMENTEVHEELVATVEVLRAVYSVRPAALQPLFQDIVDILVGWHIDSDVAPQVTHHVGCSLAAFPDLWRQNSDCAATLLSQFVEDMQDYLQEIKAAACPGHVNVEGESPEVCAKKVEYFLGVFGSVLAAVPESLPEQPLRGLGDEGDEDVSSASEPPLSRAFLCNSWLSVLAASEDLVEGGYCGINTALPCTLSKVCLSMLRHGVPMHLGEPMLISTLQLQHRLLRHDSPYSSLLSNLDMLRQLLLAHGQSLSTSLVPLLLSPGMPLRTAVPDETITQAALAVMRAAVTLKNVPLVQEIYQYILADLQLCHDVLIGGGGAHFGNRSLLSGLQYDERHASAALLFNLNALVELCNTRNSIIGMWALRPSLFTLLAVHLEPTSRTLATHNPSMHACLVKVLHSHCKVHSNFVGSSSLVVGRFSTFKPSSVFNPAAVDFTPSSPTPSSSFNPTAVDFKPAHTEEKETLTATSEVPVDEQNKNDENNTSADSPGFGGATATQNLSIILKTLENMFDIGAWQCKAMFWDGERSRGPELLSFREALEQRHRNDLAQGNVYARGGRASLIVLAPPRLDYSIVKGLPRWRMALGELCCSRVLEMCLQWLREVCTSCDVLTNKAPLQPPITALLRLASTAPSLSPTQHLHIARTLATILQQAPHLRQSGLVSGVVSLSLQQLGSTSSTVVKEYSTLLRYLPLATIAYISDVDVDGAFLPANCWSEVAEKSQAVSAGQREDLRLQPGSMNAIREPIRESGSMNSAALQLLRHAQLLTPRPILMASTIFHEFVCALEKGEELLESASLVELARHCQRYEHDLELGTAGEGNPPRDSDMSPSPPFHVDGDGRDNVNGKTRITVSRKAPLTDDSAGAVSGGGGDGGCGRGDGGGNAAPIVSNAAGAVNSTGANKPQLSLASDAKVAAYCEKSHSVLWRWLAWHAARHCVINKLRTVLGTPQDTFMHIEVLVKVRSKQLQQCSLLDVHAAGDGDDGGGVGVLNNNAPSSLLRVLLLLEFVDSLERNLLIVGSGCTTSLQPVSKSVRAFFANNRDACRGGLERLRAAAAVVALSAGQPASAARHVEAVLRRLTPSSPRVDVARACVIAARSLVSLRCPEALLGLLRYYERHDVALPWLGAAVCAAASRHEDALYILHLFLRGEEIPSNLLEGTVPYCHPAVCPSLSWTDFDLSGSSFSEAPPSVKEYIVQQISSSYYELTSYEDVVCWSAERAKDCLEYNAGALNVYYNNDYNTFASALSHFDHGRYDLMQVSLAVPDADTPRLPLAAEWPLWRRMSFVELSVLRCITEAVYCGGTVLPGDHFKTLSDVCRREVEQLLQVSCMMEHEPALRLRLMLLLQLLHQAETCVTSRGAAANVQLHDGWESSGRALAALPSNMLPLLARYSKMIAQFNPHVNEGIVSKVEVSCVRQSRRQRNYNFCQRTLLRLLGAPPDIAASCPYVSGSVLHSYLESYVAVTVNTNTFGVLAARLARETSKLLFRTGSVFEGSSSMITVVYRLYPTLLAYAQQHGSIPLNILAETGQLSARSAVKLAKWLDGHDIDLSMCVWQPLLLEAWVSTQPYLSEHLSKLSTAVHFVSDTGRAQLITQCLSLATVHCPTLAKTWYRLGSWCFKAGRNVVDKVITSKIQLIQVMDVEEVRISLKKYCPGLPADEAEALLWSVCDALSKFLPQQDQSTDDQQDELTDLRIEETEQQFVQRMELLVTSALTESADTSVSSSSEVPSEMLNDLLDVRRRAVQRHYVIYNVAVHAYIKFFDTADLSCAKHDAPQTIAALRLIRLVVKHAVELRSVFQHAFGHLPTAPFRAIIPQLFARLNHSESWVRESMSSLLCRLARDSPHLIVVPAVVGSSLPGKHNTTSITDMLAKFFQQKEDKQKSEDPPVGEVAEDEDDAPADEQEDFALVDDDADEDETVDEQDDTAEAEDDRQVMHNCFNSLVNELNKQGVGGVAMAEVLVQELRRITVLWDELWSGTLTQHASEMTKRAAHLRAEAMRLEANSSLTQQEKTQLVKTKYEIIFKPLTLVLEQLWSISSGVPETPHERNFQAVYGGLINDTLRAFRDPDSCFTPHQALYAYRKLHQTLLLHRGSHQSHAAFHMTSISPRLASLSSTDVAMPGVLGQHGQIVHIHSVDDAVAIMRSKTRPKKLNFAGHDGRKYTYLFKGLEDLHLDERIMQFLSVVNTMLCRDNSERVYRAHHYSVVPLGPRSGLIQWVDDATPLMSLYYDWEQRQAQEQARGGATQRAGVRHTQLFLQKLLPLLKAQGVTTKNRKDWPKDILQKVLLEMIEETPSDLITRELIASSPSASAWWCSRRTFNISSAVMCMVGFVIGLGDRHLANMLVRLSTGEVIHIDYNVCFEKGQLLHVAELVPYRMTQNIENALGATGVEGVFRSSCERVLSTMREGREVLLTLLETFVYDPLVDWTHDADAGYAGAMYGGQVSLRSNARDRRQRRHRIEHVLAVTMIRVRTKEIAGPWLDNKRKLMAVLLEFRHLFNLIAKQQQLNSVEELRLKELREQEEYLNAGKSDPGHPVHGLPQLHRERCKAEAKRAAAAAKLREALDQLSAGVQESESLLYSSVLHLQRKVSVSVEGDVDPLALVEGRFTSRSQRQQLDKIRQTQKDLYTALEQSSQLGDTLREELVQLRMIWQRWPTTAMMYRHPLRVQLRAFQVMLDGNDVDSALYLYTDSLAAECFVETALAGEEAKLHVAQQALQEQFAATDQQLSVAEHATSSLLAAPPRGPGRTEHTALLHCLADYATTGRLNLIDFKGNITSTDPWKSVCDYGVTAAFLDLLLGFISIYVEEDSFVHDSCLRDDASIFQTEAVHIVSSREVIKVANKIDLIRSRLFDKSDEDSLERQLLKQLLILPETAKAWKQCPSDDKESETTLRGVLVSIRHLKEYYLNVQRLIWSVVPVVCDGLYGAWCQEGSTQLVEALHHKMGGSWRMEVESFLWQMTRQAGTDAHAHYTPDLPVADARHVLEAINSVMAALSPRHAWLGELMAALESQSEPLSRLLSSLDAIATCPEWLRLLGLVTQTGEDSFVLKAKGFRDVVDMIVVYQAQVVAVVMLYVCPEATQSSHIDGATVAAADDADTDSTDPADNDSITDHEASSGTSVAARTNSSIGAAKVNAKSSSATPDSAVSTDTCTLSWLRPLLVQYADACLAAVRRLPGALIAHALLLALRREGRDVTQELTVLAQQTDRFPLSLCDVITGSRVVEETSLTTKAKLSFTSDSTEKGQNKQPLTEEELLEAMNKKQLVQRLVQESKEEALDHQPLPEDLVQEGKEEALDHQPLPEDLVQEGKEEALDNQPLPEDLVQEGKEEALDNQPLPEDLVQEGKEEALDNQPLPEDLVQEGKEEALDNQPLLDDLVQEGKEEALDNQPLPEDLVLKNKEDALDNQPLLEDLVQEGNEEALDNQPLPEDLVLESKEDALDNQPLPEDFVQEGKEEALDNQPLPEDLVLESKEDALDNQPLPEDRVLENKEDALDNQPLPEDLVLESKEEALDNQPLPEDLVQEGKEQALDKQPLPEDFVLESKEDALDNQPLPEDLVLETKEEALHQLPLPDLLPKIKDQLHTLETSDVSLLSEEVQAGQDWLKDKLAVVQLLAVIRWLHARRAGESAAVRLVEQQQRALVTSCGSAGTAQHEQHMQWYSTLLTSVKERYAALQPTLAKLKLLKDSHFATCSSLCQKLFEATDETSEQQAHVFLQWAQVDSDRAGEVLAVSERLQHACETSLRWEAGRRRGSTEQRKAEEHFMQVVSEYRRSLERHTLQQRSLTPCEEALLAKLPPEKNNAKRWLELLQSRLENELTERPKEIEAANANISLWLISLKQKVQELQQLFSLQCKLFSSLRDVVFSLWKMQFSTKRGLTVPKLYFLYAKYQENVESFFKKLRPELTGNIDDLCDHLNTITQATDDIYEDMLTVYESYQEDEGIAAGKTARAHHAQLHEVTALLEAQLPPQFHGLAAALEKHESEMAKIITNKGNKGELNPYALSVWRRVKAKLEGRDRLTDPTQPPASVWQQVNQSIEDAKNMEFLSVIYEGWTPWV